MVDDLRAVLRLAAGRKADPTAAIIDSRTLRSTPESCERAGHDGGKRKKGSMIHMAVDTLGHLLALHVTPASDEDPRRGRTSRPHRASRHRRSGSRSPMSTRAIPVHVPPMPQPPTALR